MYKIEACTGTYNTANSPRLPHACITPSASSRRHPPLEKSTNLIEKEKLLKKVAAILVDNCKKKFYLFPAFYTNSPFFKPSQRVHFKLKQFSNQIQLSKQLQLHGSCHITRHSFEPNTSVIDWCETKTQRIPEADSFGPTQEFLSITPTRIHRVWPDNPVFKFKDSKTTTTPFPLLYS